MATFTLHKETVQPWLPLKRAYIIFQFICVLFLFYYRISNLFISYPWILMTLAESIISFMWIFKQSFRWRPVNRSVMTEKLPPDEKLPGLDIFVCTIDPEKEPTVDVMNTVISAIAMDYPSNKLSIYLSDDGGSPITLFGIKEAFEFAKVWVPFCKKYDVKSRCPKFFFSALGEDEQLLRSREFEEKRDHVKAEYEKMQNNIKKFGSNVKNLCMVTDRPSRIEIINDQKEMPLVVYVSREKRANVPHRFKGGALNTLLRVSGLISNGPYVLVVDCDMNCNDASSAKQSMCFFLDPETSKDVAFVQFPQMFHNLSKKDIYDSQTRTAFTTMWKGMDGLRGPGLSGSGNYICRSALLFGSPNQKVAGDYLLDALHNFGKSNMFVESLKVLCGQQTTKQNISRDVVLHEACEVASCFYERNTNWGNEVGFSYAIKLESTITGYLLHCKGWRSTYLYPKRPCFLGCAPTDMKEGLIQPIKWSSELLLLAISKYSPFTYGLSRLPTIHCLTFCYLVSTSQFSIAYILYGFVPQICFLKGIPVFPKVTEPWFIVFTILHVSSQIQHFVEVISTGGSSMSWWNEQRSAIVKSIGLVFAIIESTKKKFGLNKAKFTLSDKAIDKDKLKKYEQGKFNLDGAAVLMAPLTMLITINIVCFFGGLWRLLNVKNFDEMFGQLFLISYILALSYPILEGFITTKRKGG